MSDYFRVVPMIRSGRSRPDYYAVTFRRGEVISKYRAATRRAVNKLRTKYRQSVVVPELYVPNPEPEPVIEKAKEKFPVIIDRWGWHYVVEGYDVMHFDAEGEVIPQESDGEDVDALPCVRFCYSFHEPDVQELLKDSRIQRVAVKKLTKDGLVRVPGRIRRQYDMQDIYLIFIVPRIEFWNGAPRFDTTTRFIEMPRKEFLAIWKPRGIERVEVFEEDIPHVPVPTLEHLAEVRKKTMHIQATTYREADIVKKRRSPRPVPTPVYGRPGARRPGILQRRNAIAQAKADARVQKRLDRQHQLKELLSFVEAVSRIRKGK